MPPLSNFISVKRRYSRSVNLERDIEIPDSLIGYVPTTRAIDGIERFLRAFSQPNSVRAWTITGPYGTGKSAFAHFLTAICSPNNSQIRKKALMNLNKNSEYEPIRQQIIKCIPKQGLLRAVATAQREPISTTILKALNRSASSFWSKGRGRRPDIIYKINNLYLRAQKGELIKNDHIIDAIKALVQASKTSILLVIDELGKNLEFSAQNQSVDDLYLLQQIAELPSGENDPKIFLFGLLHQSFGDYGHGLAAAKRNEWAKIQGRFEDIHYIESSERMVRLIGHAIKQVSSEEGLPNIKGWAKNWKSVLTKNNFSKNISINDISSIYPIHPIAAFILPILCSKFSQNDRTLFTFLASSEPSSFTQFLNETSINDDLPAFKIDKIYDYFVESAGMFISSRPQSQKWIEIQGRLSDANDLMPEARSALKTIGLLNIISSNGPFKASKEIVALSMCDMPNDPAELSKWHDVIDTLLNKDLITWRKQIDELRIWEGSDFDIEKEIADKSQLKNISIADLLNEHFPLSPVIAQRHSYQTGTLRYFERRYFDQLDALNSIKCVTTDSDGLIYYWVGDKEILKNLNDKPDKTNDSKPLVILDSSEINSIKLACFEYVALNKIEKDAIKLQTDGVARREVNQRLFISQKLLEKALFDSFDFASSNVSCWGLGELITFESRGSFQSYLSFVCDVVYDQGLCLWNELINRRELTSQGSAARRKLIEAMLDNEGAERLGLEGHGPECSIFDSVLKQSRLYRKEKEGWSFSLPEEDSGIFYVWNAIESFCKSAIEAPKTIDELYTILNAPPHGMKQGPIPILLLSVLLHHKDYLSLYLDGTFIPIIGVEHFELLVKKPARFAVKYFEIRGVKEQIFKELEKTFTPNIVNNKRRLRNLTILSIVKPLLGFITKLPAYSLNTNEALSAEAIAVRKELLKAKEPDHLIFQAIPKALGLKLTYINENNEPTIGKNYRKKIVQVLKELQTAYQMLLTRCEELLYQAFAVRSDIGKLREDLRVRSSYLVGQVMEDQLKRFIYASTNEEDDDETWLETILMIIADKPPRSWQDDDEFLFETKLSDLARRFRNLEALQKEKDLSGLKGKGFDVRRVTITQPNGQEIHQMVWTDRDQLEKINNLVKSILEKKSLKNNENLQRAVTTALLENVFRPNQLKSDHGSEAFKEEQKVGHKEN
jgi:hypothetical protein